MPTRMSISAISDSSGTDNGPSKTGMGRKSPLNRRGARLRRRYLSLSHKSFLDVPGLQHATARSRGNRWKGLRRRSLARWQASPDGRTDPAPRGPGAPGSASAPGHRCSKLRRCAISSRRSHP